MAKKLSTTPLGLQEWEMMALQMEIKTPMEMKTMMMMMMMRAMIRMQTRMIPVHLKRNKLKIHLKNHQVKSIQSNRTWDLQRMMPASPYYRSRLMRSNRCLRSEDQP